MKTKTYLLLILIILFGVFYRMFNLTAQSIWVDEGFTWFLTQQPDLLAVLKTDVHPPLYFALVTLWVQIVGTSELSLRYFSVLPSILCLAMMIPLAGEIWRLGNRTRQGIALSTFMYVCVLLLAIADIEIYIGQEARAYSLHVLLGMLGVWAMLRWLRTHKNYLAVVWLISSVLLLYTQYFGAWLLIVEGIYLLAFVRGQKRLIGIFALVVAGLLFLPWALWVILPYQLQTIGGYTPADSSNFATIQNYLVAYFSGQWVLTLGIAGIGFGAFLHATRQYIWRPVNASVFLWLWLLVPFGITFVLNIPNANLLFDYRLSQISPAVVLLIALGLMNFTPNIRWFLVGVIVVYGVLHVDAFRYKEDWRGYGQAITQYVQMNDAIALDFGGGDFQMQYYLEKFAPPNTPIIALRQRAQLYPQTYEADALQFFNDHATIWLVRWNTSNDALDKLAFTNHVRTASIPIETQMGMNLWLYRYDQLSAEPIAIFDNGMVLQQVTVDEKTLQVNLWWRNEKPLDIDYTTSVLILNADGIAVAQQDNPPAPSTTQWSSNITYWETKQAQILQGSTLPEGQYQVVVQVYEWRPDGIVPVLIRNTNNPLIVYEFIHVP